MSANEQICGGYSVHLIFLKDFVFQEKMTPIIKVIHY